MNDNFSRQEETRKIAKKNTQKWKRKTEEETNKKQLIRSCTFVNRPLPGEHFSLIFLNFLLPIRKIQNENSAIEICPQRKQTNSTFFP